MIKNILFYSFIGLTILVLFYYFSATSSSEYSESIKNHHKQQERDLSEGDSLEITKRLNYFTVNPNYITTAKVEHYDSINTVVINFSKNKETAIYKRIAKLYFTLNQENLQLTLFKNTETNDFILPFKDSTNSDKTNATGRYLPIEFHNQEYIDLDFNKGYNPYCAYDSSYACAITPEENHLPIWVNAGELKY